VTQWAPTGHGGAVRSGPRGNDCVLVALALTTRAVTARAVPGHQARYHPFLTVARTDRPWLRVIVTPVTPAPIEPSTIVSACPSESDSPAPLSSTFPAGMPREALGALLQRRRRVDRNQARLRPRLELATALRIR